ncbi:MAG: pilus assembly protein PilM [Patescibacteria group bacterium]
MSFFYRLLPPPSYLDFTAIGLDISDRSIKYAELAETKKGIRLKRFGSKSLDAGIIVSGEIKKPDALSAILASIFKPLKAGYVVSALPEERGYISVMALPQAEKEQIREAVELSLPEKIPLPAGEAIFDFEFMPQAAVFVGGAKIKEDQIPHQDAVVYAFPKAVVQGYLEMYLAAGLRPISFVMETEALSRALISKDDKNAPIMIVDFGRTRTTFVIIAGGLVRFSSTVNVAGEFLNQAIAKSLKISIRDAESVKKEKGMLNSPENSGVYDATLPVVAAVADEIERHIIFWNTHAEHIHGLSPEISKIIISGGDSNLAGFKEYLGFKIGLPVEYGNAWTNVAPFEEYVPEIKFNESLSYSTAIGLGLIALEEN